MSCRDRLVEERRFRAASRYVLMWKRGPSGPRQRREKKEPSPAGTAEKPREFKTKAIRSIATRP